MRNLLISLLLMFSLSVFAAEVQQTIELKDGTKVLIKTDGNMVHLDAAGKRIRMRNGVVMEGKDGAKYMMKNDALWQQIIIKGTLNPK